MQDSSTLLHPKNKGADQPAYLCSLIIVFVICFLKSIMIPLATSRVPTEI